MPPALCRDCFARFEGPGPCPSCRSPRVVRHAELDDLHVAHMDCDAFYASVEKRDDPAIRDRPVIVGGGRRGVVTTCCYIARIEGVRSAMPMFKALKLCPDAVVVKPRFDVYVEVSRRIREIMEALTPLVEPLSLDEAFLDLKGGERLFGEPPAVSLARLAKLIEAEVGITVSIGLAPNKFLAKIASDLEKPRGFSVVGEAEKLDFLAPLPVSKIWGVGAVARARLEKDGLRRIADLRRVGRDRLVALHGGMGDRLWRLAHGEDLRDVSPDHRAKSISNETTFADDVADHARLDGYLWRMAEKVADRAKAKAIVGRVVTLKLKRADHQILTRRVTPGEPAQLADQIYRAAAPLLAKEVGRGPFRLLGVGISDLVREAEAAKSGDLLDPGAGRRGEAERASDRIRAKFGADAILKGRSLR